MPIKSMTKTPSWYKHPNKCGSRSKSGKMCKKSGKRNRTTGYVSCKKWINSPKCRKSRPKNRSRSRKKRQSRTKRSRKNISTSKNRSRLRKKRHSKTKRSRSRRNKVSFGFTG